MNTSIKLDFTLEAKKQINKIVLETVAKKYFRISVKGGGCSGFKYSFNFEDKIEKNEPVFLDIFD